MHEIFNAVLTRKYAPFEYKPPSLNRKCTVEVFTIFMLFNYSIISPSIVLKPESYCKQGGVFLSEYGTRILCFYINQHQEKFAISNFLPFLCAVYIHTVGL